MSRGTSCGQLWCREAVKLRKCPGGVGGRRHPGVSGQSANGRPTLPGPFPPAFPAGADPTGRCQPRRCVLTPVHRAAKLRSRAVLPSKRVVWHRPGYLTPTPTAAAAAAAVLCRLTDACSDAATLPSRVSSRVPTQITIVDLWRHNSSRCGTSPTLQTNASKSTRLPRLAQLRSSSRLCPSTLPLSTRPPKISTT